MAGPGQEPADWYFPGDNRFTPFIRRQLKPGQYARYVDDFVLFGRSKQELTAMRLAIEEFLIPWRLQLHPVKSRVYPIADGFTFLGWRIFPTHTRLVKPNIKRFRARLAELRHDYRNGRLDWDDVNQCVQSWIGHASHGDTWRLREKIFDDFPFILAHPPKGEKDGPG